MSSAPEIAQLQILAEMDALVERLNRWTEVESPWEPMQQSRALLKRLLARAETLRVRIESPLVVATFGGTGTGKSTLTNALIGQECTATGKQRPTTTRPVLVAHTTTDLQLLGLPLDEFSIVQSDVPLLRDMVLIDCPDPDTNEAETPGSNIARLHQILHYCDVLIYTATQQKYRSARVTEELLTAATGCRLVFVQTFADVDTDIRDDWRRQLEGDYDVPELFFVDSVRALQEQQADRRPTGDFHRLQDLLTNELGHASRVQIRRANLVDLMLAAVNHCREHLAKHEPAIERLQESLEEQQRKLTAVMSEKLCAELLASRHLWEKRLLGSVTQTWGISPFSTILRLYNGLGNLIASAGLFRARSSAQMALIGLVQGARWVGSKQQEMQSDSRMERLATLGLDDSLVRETQLVVAGHLQEARLDPQLLEASRLNGLRDAADRVEQAFLEDASQGVNEIVEDLSKRHSRFFVRAGYEFCLLVLLAYIVGWPAYHFFYAHPWLGKELIPSDFYVHAAVFLAIWSGLLVMAFTRRLRRGLNRRVSELAQSLAQGKLSGGLFPQFEKSIRQVRVQQESLESMSQSISETRSNIAVAPALGAQSLRLKKVV